MQLRHLIFIFFSTFPLYGLDTTLLTTQKQAIFEQKLRAIKASAHALKYNWISPLTLSTSLNSSEGIKSSQYNALIQFNQDIYRSGGIGHSMNYAENQLAYDLLDLESQNAALYKEILIGALELQQLQITLEQNEYQLKNSEIEIFLKTQQYKTGNVDITEMNNAIMNKNNLLKTMIATKESIANKKIALTQLSNQPVEKIRVKYFEPITQEQFIQNSFGVLQAKIESQLAGTEYAIDKSSYLPSISVNGQLGYQDALSQSQQINGDKNYHSLGISLSMPIDFNAPSKLEAQEASYLQQRIEISDIESEQEVFYQQQMQKIDDYNSYQELTQKNMSLYEELIKVSKQGFQTGYTAGYDLQTLENTQKIDERELQINRLNIQIALAELYLETNLGVNYYE